MNYKLLPNSAVAVGTVQQGMWRVSYGMCRVAALILRRFSVQEHDTDRTTPSMLYCEVFHSQNRVECICTRCNLVKLQIYSVLYSECLIK